MSAQNTHSTTSDYSLAFAKKMDKNDPLRGFRQKFHIPKHHDGKPVIYLCGNSLGLQPKSTKSYILQELEDWKNHGVEGHFQAKHPWMPYHEFLTEKMAKVVGGKPSEVVVMNTLTTNLHLMMVSFYRPTKERYKILTEWNPFPSDQYAVQSQARYHGFDPEDAILEPQPKGDSLQIELEDILELIEKEGDKIALVMLGGVNYYTGQLYNLKAITAAAHKKGCMVGFDLAHAAGNVKLELHDSGCDFAVWCSYKYLNSGPGSLAGCFVNVRHANSVLPRFEGWWGNDKKVRFKMEKEFIPIGGAETWQLSNPPILSMAAIMASLDVFDEAGMDRLVAKSKLLTAYLYDLIKAIPSNKIRIITPENPSERGCQLSIQVKGADKRIFDSLTNEGIVTDWREPDVIRVAPVPLYNSFSDAWYFAKKLEKLIIDNN
ncbi:MAG: kynureninase [Saprospiraceae bacterium]